MNYLLKNSGFLPPDSRIAKDARELVSQLHSPALLHHVHRTWCFAELIGQRRNLKYDRELVYLAGLLHDLGLTGERETESRFEVDGADAACEFLRGRGYPDEKSDLVWEAIALHTSIGIASRKQPEVALIHFGALADVVGMGLDEIDPALLHGVLENYPRFGFKKAFQEALAEVLKRKPHTVMTLAGLKDIGNRHVHGFSCPNFCDLIDGAPFES